LPIKDILNRITHRNIMSSQKHVFPPHLWASSELCAYTVRKKFGNIPRLERSSDVAANDTRV
jgi:hypothetical protein